MWSQENGQLGLSRFCFIHLGLQSTYIFAMTSTIKAVVPYVSVCRLCCASSVYIVCCVVCLHGHPYCPCFAKGGLFDPCVMLDFTDILKNVNQENVVNIVASIELQQTVTKERLTTHAGHNYVCINLSSCLYHHQYPGNEGQILF